MNTSFDDDTLESNLGTDDDAFVKVVESGQIGFRLAEEIRSLREELLVIKQEKRILLVNNETLEEALNRASGGISSLQSALHDAEKHLKKVNLDRSKQEARSSTLEDEAKPLRKALSAEKKKSKFLGEELERSLEDEAALRAYCRRLENEAGSFKEQNARLQEELKTECEERMKGQKYVDSALRSGLILVKKLETIVFLCEKDVDMHTSSVLDLSPDYLDSLFNDLKSSMMSSRADPINPTSTRAMHDFALLEHKQHNCDHLVNQSLNTIR
jgi:chromosome segregation ATPase